MTKQTIKPILDQNACDFSPSGNQAIDELVQARLNTLGPTSVLFYKEPLEMVRGRGVWLFDNEDNQYLDAYNNVAVLGHSHPAVTDAVSTQLTKINTHSRYLDSKSHQYASKLLATLPMNDARLVMTCTGSEANDLAIRLAQMKTGQMGIIVSEAAYHGNTYLVNQVSPSSSKTLPDWVATFSLDALRNEHISTDEAINNINEQIKLAITELQQKGFGCAALLADSIFSSDGVFAFPVGFLTQAVETVRAAGGVFIADEVQPGFGRTGEQFWGFMRHSTAEKALIPDIVTFGKPMANGYPVAGLVTDNAALQAFSNEDGYFNTFAGSHVAIAAANAVFDTVKTEQLQANALRVGQYFKKALIELQQRFSMIRNVRGVGLFLAVDIQNKQGQSDASLTSTVINLMRQNKVLIGAAAKEGSTLKIRPPLCFEQQHVEHFISIFTDVLIQLDK